MRITPDMAWDMKVMYEAGYGLVKIAARYDGICFAGVRYHLRKQGVVLRSRGVRDPMSQTVFLARVREYKKVVATDMAARQNQTCVQCGVEYAKDRWTMLCGSKRCRQQREYNNRRNDPVRYAKDRVTTLERRRRQRRERADEKSAARMQ